MPVSRVVAVNPSLVVERVGSDYLMLTASGAEVVRATGDAADVITCAINGQPLPQRLHTAADVLQRHGVLTTTTSVTNTFTPSRRHALQLGAAAAAVGLTMLALPNAAAAASVVAITYTFNKLVDDLESTALSSAYCTSVFGADSFSYDIELKESGTFTLTSGTRNANIILVGGGGSGSNPTSGGGGGGGGGEVRQGSFTVDNEQPYDIIVGDGGAAVTQSPRTGSPGGNTAAFDMDSANFAATGGTGGDGDTGGSSGYTAGALGGAYSGGTSFNNNGGGGGGAGGFGGNGEFTRGGSGGLGYSYDGGISYLAVGGGGGGGGGGGSGSAAGGTGGFPSLPSPGTPGTAGAPNTGNGGGGGYAGNGSGAGGSGIVIVRFYGACGPPPSTLP